MSITSWFKWFWYELWRCQVFWSTFTWFPVRYFGRNNIPLSGPVMLVSNHQSHLDPPLVGCAIPRQPYYMARKTLFTNPVLGRFFASIHAFPIDLGGVGVGGIKECLRLLKSGEMVVIFPEGTRSPTGEIRPFRAGFTALATRTKATIVPAAIEGSFDAWPKNKSYPTPRQVYVRYGEPITPEEVGKLDDADLLQEVERRVREAQAWIHQRFGVPQRGA
jgi:1-acyl-sn-glycerol-3-phosphate acyltransferase